MVRTFNTHTIRKQRELTGLWDFTPKGGEFAGKTRRVVVPSCWENYPGLRSYRGEATYQTTVTANGNLRLICHGVSHTAEVFVNQSKIAEHYGAYTAFDGIVPNAAGTQTIRIDVSNAFSEDSALHVPNDYYSYGGISRPVVLEELGDAYLHSVHCTPIRTEGGWNLAIAATVQSLSSKEQTLDVATTIAQTTISLGRVQLSPGERLTIEGTTPVPKVEPYEPKNPVLYFVTTTLARPGEEPFDDLIERVGFREVQVSGEDILYNGAKIRIKGFNRHEDHPHFGCAIPLAMMDKDINMMQDMGANLVRTCHYPNDSLFLDLCDEKGMLVWEENHARGLTEEQMRNPNFRQQCEWCIDEMIDQHFNHPSIIIWGILNECASETAYGRSCYAEQFAQIKALDTSRPTSFASCKFFDDISLDLPDIVSYNIYPRWYHDAPVEDYLMELRHWIQKDTGGAGKPFLISEVGAGAIYGNRSEGREKWSEERQVDILEEQISTILSKDWCSGIILWQYCDVRITEEGNWFATRPRTMNNKGAVDEYRRPKLAAQTIKKLFTEIE